MPGVAFVSLVLICASVAHSSQGPIQIPIVSFCFGHVSLNGVFFFFGGGGGGGGGGVKRYTSVS